jgi:hypothetical protein
MKNFLGFLATFAVLATFVVLLSATVVSCIKPSNDRVEQNIFKNVEIAPNNIIREVYVIEIDSCEYLWAYHGGGPMLTHKGNCKYCAEREKNKKQVTN